MEMSRERRSSTATRLALEQSRSRLLAVPPLFLEIFKTQPQVHLTTMQDAASWCCHREVQDLYHAWLLANDAADSSLDRHSCRDKNLLAIAQLAAIKLRTQRAIISLIDGESQHILAEASNTLSPFLDSSSANHELLSGVNSQPLSNAFYEQQIFAESTSHSKQSCPPQPDHFVSTDCRTDDRFKDHPFVKEEGGVRFALGAPLISKYNHTIGILLVLDGSPRDSVKDTDLSELKDCAQCVVRHLELVHSSVSASKETHILRGIAECFPNPYRTFSDQDQRGKSEGSTKPKGDTDECIVEIEDGGHTDLDNGPTSIETSIQAAFDGVASMLRDRSMADGAVIFGPPAVANLIIRDDNTNLAEHDEKSGKETSSTLLASSLQYGIVCSAIEKQTAPPVCLLRRLASVYPCGMVFNVTDGSLIEQVPMGNYRHPSSDASAKETEEVLAMLYTEILNDLADVQTSMYLPVYDRDDKSLLASCFVWSEDGLYAGNNHRDISDYHVLGSFLSHNVGQLKMQNKDAEQRKFMSNFSHELRTPINGILGSAQFLQDTVSDDYQNELLQSIVVSSNTLLDTLNIVLDYTKFEHAVTEVENPSAEEGASSALPASIQPFYVEADVDLALLVEDATETVVAGHFFDNLPPDTETAGVVDRSDDRYRARQGTDRGTTQDVKVILQLSARPSWSVKTSPGAISRVIMNLVGNALKFTQTGNIAVELESKSAEDSSKVKVRLRVEDTGIGMTEHFVRHHLFAPYRQGNSFSPGVGLGMSVFKHMVSSLHGDISISSTVGKGTAVNVDLTLDASDNPNDGIPADLRRILSRIKGKHLVLLDIGNMYDDQPKDAIMRRTDALRSVASDWLGMRVSTSTDIDVADADFYLFSEPPPIDDILKRHQKAARENSANMEVPLVVVATDSREAHMINRNHAVSLEKTGRIVQVLSQPCGPRKLAKVLNLCQDRVEQSKRDRTRKEDDGDTTAGHRPSEAEPDTDRDKYGKAEDGQTVEDMDGPPSVSGVQSPPKKVSRLSSDDDSGREEDAGKRQDHAGDGDQSNDEPTEAGADAQGPEASVPHPPFTKPLVLSRSPADAAPCNQNKLKERNLHGLCVDDNKINLRLLVTLMRKEKHTYEQSENGQEALEVFQASNGPQSSEGESRQPFDFILMDIGMPVMNGIQCTKAIREYEREHELRPTYIVACTAWGDGQTQREAKEAGMDAFLPKPLKFAHLKELLAGLMERE